MRLQLAYNKCENIHKKHVFYNHHLHWQVPKWYVLRLPLQVHSQLSHIFSCLRTGRSQSEGLCSGGLLVADCKCGSGLNPWNEEIIMWETQLCNTTEIFCKLHSRHSWYQNGVLFLVTVTVYFSDVMFGQNITKSVCGGCTLWRDGCPAVWGSSYRSGCLGWWGLFDSWGSGVLMVDLCINTE